MSGQGYNQDDLSNKFAQQSVNDGQQQGQRRQYSASNFQSFQPNNAASFTPGQSYGGYGGYQQGGYQQGGYQQGGYQQGGYNNYNQGGYNNYNQGYNNNYDNYNQGYNQYNNYQQQQQPAQSRGMSLEDYQKQATASAPKVKKTLKLASSSGIKIANAPKKEEPKKEEPKKQETKAEIKKETLTPKVETKKEESPAPKAEAKKESTSSSSAPVPAPVSVAADAVAKEQEEEVDEEVVNDMYGGKDHVSIIFMGHVDAGKSTMGGNLLYLTGTVDKRTVEKYEKEAKDAGRQGWYLSWIMDTNKEERNDGKTIEVGKSYFETEKRRYTILDAPGHKMYVSEMIGGASQADVGILVISARKGEYETGFEKGGQTREHALLAKTQGVNKMIVVVNKMDDPTVGWSKERYDECTQKLGLYLKGVGYNVKEDVQFMPVSGYTGDGLKERVPQDKCPWYNGPSLLEYLDNMQHLNRYVNAPFMLPVSGKMKDLGTIVEGKIESGHVKTGNKLILMPNRTNVEVLTIYNETENEVNAAYCGEQVRIKLKGVEEEDISSGFVLSSPKAPVKTVTRFEAQIAIVELKSILSSGFSCVMHVHTAIEEVTFKALLHKLEKGTNRKSKKPPAFAKKGMKIIAVLETAAPVCVETYQDYEPLGRFTLRDQGQTIAIGKITKLLE
jgi:peptide chain release factor subunit 3